MFDQSFSAKNLRKIFDYENRKGHFLEGKFFPELEMLTGELKDCAQQIRAVRRRKGLEVLAGTYGTRLTELYERRRSLREAKQTQLMRQLELVSSQIESPGFTLNIEAGAEVNGKQVYTAEDSPATYFALKKIQQNIRRLYKVQQSSRYQIICQLRELLRDRLPKYVFRLDFRGFYEEIPRQKLIKQISDDPLLTLSSKKLIKRILWEYGALSGDEKGLPRGIGVSAYLAELFMRHFDDRVRSFAGVVYYARYVDDIVAILVPMPNHDEKPFQDYLHRQVSDSGLVVNSAKTFVRRVDGHSQHAIDFLGYRIEFGNGDIRLGMTATKVAKYKARLDASFAAYRHTPPCLEKAHRRLLVKRVRFLTGNTRLVNNKRRAAVGVYFSNSLLSDDKDLRALDAHLAGLVASVGNARLQSRLAMLGFATGFHTRRYNRFSARDLSDIVRVWKYA